MVLSKFLKGFRKHVREVTGFNLSTKMFAGLIGTNWERYRKWESGCQPIIEEDRATLKDLFGVESLETLPDQPIPAYVNAFSQLNFIKPPVAENEPANGVQQRSKGKPVAMAYRLEKKSLDELLLQAACYKWEVGMEFFHNNEARSGGKNPHTDKRRTLYWLLYTDCKMTYAEIANRFGYHKDSMREGIENLDFMKGVYPSIANDIANIREIAGKLQVNMEVEVSVKIK